MFEELAASPAPSERLIVALDLPTANEALELVDRLGDVVQFYKVGLELISSGTGIQLMEQLITRNYNVFADFKLFDVPATVYRSVRNLNDLGITFLTVHGDPAIMEAAVSAGNNISILAVTVLTSMNDQSLQAIGYQLTTEELVLMRAVSAHQYGCAGVISSAKEARSIRQHVKPSFRIVTPGIRSASDPTHDQKRTMSVADAIQAGADYVVVGRPIRDAQDPRLIAENYQSEIRRALSAVQIS